MSNRMRLIFENWRRAVHEAEEKIPKPVIKGDFYDLLQPFLKPRARGKALRDKKKEQRKPLFKEQS